MSVLTKLLDFLPTCFNIDPQQISAFTLSYDDENARVEHSIQDNVFTTKVFSSFTNDIEIDLDDLTIGELVEKINTHHNYSATVHSFGQKSAMCLADVKNSEDEMVYIFTSPTWVFYKAMAMELKEAHEMMEEGLKQMSIQGSTGVITDYWCNFFNGTRKTGEQDIDFGIRTIREIRMPKSNNVAIEEILKENYGYDIVCIDLLFEQTAVMEMNNKATPVHNRYYPITDSTAIEVEPGTFALIFPNNTISGWTGDDINGLRKLVYSIHEAGTRCKVFWSDLPDTEWMLMNDTNTPVHDSNYILPITKNSEFFSFYL
ncbi:MAG: hypothetical protein MI863_05210 [Desulfobacterales bacterium]|nr:hypothetical protein [Desulfobacterales bacterium]